MLVRERLVIRWDAYELVQPDERLLREIGRLRRRGYAASGKATGVGEPLVEGLDRAGHVRHMIWRGPTGRVIAAVRLSLPQTEDDRFDVDDEIDLTHVIPDRRCIGEASRLVVDPDVRPLRALLGMTTAVSYELVRAGRRRVLLCADGRLGAFYKTIGCRDLETPFVHDRLGSTAHDLYLGPVRAAVEGRYGLAFPVWAAVFAPASSRLLQQRQFRYLSPAQQIWLRWTSSCAAVLRVASHWMRSVGGRRAAQ